MGSVVCGARTTFRALIAASTLGYPCQGHAFEGEPLVYVDPSIEGGFLYGTTTADRGEDVSLYGGGVMVGVRARIGDLGLGGRSGVILHPTAGYYGASATDGAGLTLLNLGANAGYEYLDLGQDGKSTRHSGWGVFAGYRAAFTETRVTILHETATSNDFSHGPVLSLLLPSYDYRLYELEMGYLTLLLLPFGDPVFFTFSVGYQF